MPRHDYLLIYLRSENARISLKQLSRHLKKSPQRLKYSISVLEKKEILNEPYCIFDYSYFGLIFFRVYFKGAYITERYKQIIISELTRNPYVTSLYELTGEFDLAVEFASPNPSRFNKEFKKIITANPSLKDYKILLNVVTHIYPRNYLIEDENMHTFDPEIIIGGDRDEIKFSQNEMTLIRYMLIDPTIRFIGLEKTTGLNVKTVKSTLNDLQKNRIIKKVKYILDINKLSINCWRVFIKLHNLSLEREAQFMAHLLKTNEVIQSNKTVGDWDIEIDIESLDKKKIMNALAGIKEEFTDIIERFSLIELYKYNKITYLPKYLFEQTSHN